MHLNEHQPSDKDHIDAMVLELAQSNHWKGDADQVLGDLETWLELLADAPHLTQARVSWAVAVGVMVAVLAEVNPLAGSHKRGACRLRRSKPHQVVMHAARAAEQYSRVDRPGQNAMFKRLSFGYWAVSRALNARDSTFSSLRYSTQAVCGVVNLRGAPFMDDFCESLMDTIKAHAVLGSGKK